MSTTINNQEISNPPLPPPLNSIRHTLIETAISFLSDETVKSASISVKSEFLKRKGLNDDELRLALMNCEDIYKFNENL